MNVSCHQTHHCGYRFPWHVPGDEQPNFHGQSVCALFARLRRQAVQVAATSLCADRWFCAYNLADFHHERFTGNYGLSGVLDWLHGTDKEWQVRVPL